MISRLAKARDRLGEAFSRERRIIEKATCCLRFDRGKLFKLIDDVEALYEAALEVLIDEADKWMSRLSERIGRKGTRYLATEWRGIRIEMRPYSGVETVHIAVTKSFADEVDMPYPSVEAGIEPIEQIPAEVRRMWAVGWHASDAFIDGKGRPEMETTDIGQVLAWALAWPGKFRIIAVGLVIGEKTKPWWHAYSLSHRAIELVPEAVGAAGGDEIKSPKYRLVKLLNDPLALLAYTLGDGSLSVGKSYKLRWAIAPNHMDELVEAVSAVLDKVNAGCGVRRREEHREIYVTSGCASALAKTMLNALESNLPICKRLLDAVYADEPNSKYARLAALAGWEPRIGLQLVRLNAPRVEVCGYVFSVHFDESNGLFAEIEVDDVNAVTEATRQCLGANSGIRIAHREKRTRVRLGTAALELALRRLAKEDPDKAKQVIKAIVDYLLKRAEEYEARGKAKAAQKARNKAKKLASFLQNADNSDILQLPLHKTIKPIGG